MQVKNSRIEDMDWNKTYVLGLDNISGMPLFTQCVVQRGYSDGDIKKVLGQNALPLLKINWKG
jgi:microsomal dipeptidase-like Zn-dependent dipeptidase